MSLPASGPKRIATGGLERGEIELVDNPTVRNVRAGKRRDGWPLVSGMRSSRDGGRVRVAAVVLYNHTLKL
jgi:hypothetical protein